MKEKKFCDLADVNAPYAQALKDAAARIIDSGRYVGGPEVAAFEKALAAHTGTGYAVGVSNGLDALRLILRAYIELGRLKAGDEVIVPSNTYIASVLAITDSGLTPVFVEPDVDTLNLDTSLLEAAITDRTRAIMTVHLYGRACFDATMLYLARRHGLLIIEDNAQAIGAEAYHPLRGEYVRTGALGDAAAFSFYPTKNLGALGDAGAVTTDDEALASAVRALANYGSDVRYHNIYEGYNCRLDPLQAAFLSVKLPHLDEETRRRRELARTYDRCINNPAVAKPLVEADDRCVWHQYVVRCDSRDALQSHLAQNHIATDIHYPLPPHRQPCYSRFGTLSLPIADRLGHTVLSLPMSVCTSVADAVEISEIINSFGR